MSRQRPRSKAVEPRKRSSQRTARASSSIRIDDLHLSDIAGEFMPLTGTNAPAPSPREAEPAAPIEVTIDDRHLRELIELREVSDKWAVVRTLTRTFAACVLILLVLVCCVAAASPTPAVAAELAGSLLGSAATFIAAVASLFGGAALTTFLNSRRKAAEGSPKDKGTVS